MWNKPTVKQLKKIPMLYSQDGKKDPTVYMKFFLGNWTWYVLEFDGNNTFYGLVVSGFEPQGEFGYFTLSELMNLNVRGIEVDRDKYQVTPYAPRKLSIILAEDGVKR